MPKKKTRLIRRDDDLQDIDDALDTAIAFLDGTNRRVGELLESFEPEPEELPIEEGGDAPPLQAELMPDAPAGQGADEGETAPSTPQPPA